VYSKNSDIAMKHEHPMQ